MVRQVGTNQDKDRQFPEMLTGEVLPAASTDLQLNYAFYQLREMIELRTKGKRLGCLDPHPGEETARTDIGARARQVTLIKEAILYTLKCRHLEVQLATDWNIPTCFKELPV